MKKFFTALFILVNLCCFVSAKPINSNVYKTMSPTSYGYNYNRQINNRPMPYWQAQSNFATRNRVYSNYSGYQNYNNYINQHNYTTRMMRGSYR